MRVLAMCFVVMASVAFGADGPSCTDSVPCTRARSFWPGLPWGRKAPCNCPSCNPPCNPTCPKDIPTPKDLPVPKDLPKDLTPPQEQVQVEETGVFVAPPRTGTTRGAVNRTGIEGLAITLPAIKISLPGIELPACYHMRDEAKMIVNQAEAPYLRTGTQVKHLTTPAQAPAQKDLAPKPADCETQLRELEEKYARLKQELDRCLGDRKALQDAGSKQLNEPAAKPYKPGDIPVPLPGQGAQAAGNQISPVIHVSDDPPVVRGRQALSTDEVYDVFRAHSR